MAAESSEPGEPIPIHAGSVRTNRRTYLLAALLGTFGLFVALYLWLGQKTPPSRPPLPDLAQLNEFPDDIPTDSNPGYLGSQACVECHAQRVADFSKTPHANACRRPQDGPMPSGFDSGNGLYVTAEPGLRFDMTHEGKDYFLNARQQKPEGEQKSRSRIDLVYGANKADEVFFTWRGDRLFEQMVVWLHPTNQWANTPYNPHGTGEFARESTTRCLECHNTWFEHVPGTANEYKPDSFVLGVSCEKCHGPGKEHVQFHREHPKDKSAHAIVHPGTLVRERQIEVCTQCHGNSTKSRGPVNRYRPGEILEEYYRTARSRHPEEDHVANQIKYLRESKCFQNSDTMSCITCHDPHRPHDAAHASKAHQSCFQCHKPEACGDRPNLPSAIRDDCVSCHMPQRVWMNVHFHTANDRYLPPIRRYDHKIRKHPVARSERLLDWHRTQKTDASRREAERLSSELAEYWLGEVETRRKDYRFLASIGAARESLRVEPPPAIRKKAEIALRETIAIQSKLDSSLIDALQAINERHPTTAIEILNNALTVKPDWAVAHGKLGLLYPQTGQIEKATKHLEAVAEHDPDNAAGLGMLGWLAYLRGRSKEAEEFYRRADEIEPFDAKINYHWALAILQRGDWKQAEGRLRRVLEIDPRHVGASQGLSQAYRHLDRPADAVRYAWRAARLSGFEDSESLVNLADCYAEAGRDLEAAAAAIKAIEQSATRDVRLPIDMQRRMESIRTKAGY